MKYYSTNKQAPEATLEEAVVKGLAADKGLFMPFTIKTLPQEFYDSIDTLSFQEIAYRVADAFFGEDVPADTLKQIVYDTLSFDVPLVRVTENIYSLELFHGPTLAFKDVGGRFMANLNVITYLNYISIQLHIMQIIRKRQIVGTYYLPFTIHGSNIPCNIPLFYEK